MDGGAASRGKCADVAIATRFAWGEAGRPGRRLAAIRGDAEKRTRASHGARARATPTAAAEAKRSSGGPVPGIRQLRGPSGPNRPLKALHGANVLAHRNAKADTVAPIRSCPDSEFNCHPGNGSGLREVTCAPQHDGPTVSSEHVHRKQPSPASMCATPRNAPQAPSMKHEHHRVAERKRSSRQEPNWRALPCYAGSQARVVLARASHCVWPPEHGRH